MADLISEIKWLKFHHSSESAMKDKDFLKNKSYDKYSDKVTTFIAVPFFFQLWQIKLLGNVEKATLYNKVRFFKAASLIGAIALGTQEHIALK